MYTVEGDKYRVIKGNLIHAALASEFDVIAHGCNCFCTMEAGIAKQIKQVFNEAYQADLRTIKGDKRKLGTISYAPIYRGMHNRDHIVTVVNAYTQYAYGENRVNADYDAIRNCMKVIKKQYSGQRIGLPMIGCGLAGGDWKVVTVIIQDELEGEDVTVMWI